MSSALDILIRLVTTGQGEAQNALNTTSQGADSLNNSLSQVGDNTGLNEVRQNANGAASELEQATQKAEAFKDKLEGVRNGALAVAAGGAGLLAMGEHYTEAFVGADRLAGKMNSFMRSKGLDDSIDQVSELAGKLAGLTGGDDDEIAAGIAQAVASGRLNSLRQYGIVISEQGLAAIKTASALSEQAGAQETVNQVMLAGGDAVKTLSENMDESTATLGDFSNRYGNLEEGIGKGSAKVKAAIINNVLSPILSVVEASPELQETAGAFLEIGGTVASVGGSVVAFGAQVGQIYTSMRIAKLAGAAASGTAAAAAEGEAIASATAGAAALASGGAAATGAAGHDVLAASEGAASLAAGTEAGAVSVAGAASLASGGAAATGAVGFGALALGIWAACAPLLVFVAIAGAAALAMWGLDKAIHASEDNELQENIDKGNATNQARLDAANAQRKKRGQSEITVEQWQAMESDDGTVMTPEDANKPKAWKSGGEGSGAPTDGGVDLGKLQKMVADGKAGAATPSTPVTSTASAMASVPEVPSGAASLALPSPKAKGEKEKGEASVKALASKGASASEKSPSKDKGDDDNAALRKYLEAGGDVNQWDAKANKEGGKAGSMGKGGASSAPQTIRVPMPEPKQTDIGGGKLLIEFLPPKPMIIDNPLARHLENL